MKKTLVLLWVFLTVLALGGILKAQEKQTVAVLPFTVYSAENIDYMRQGVWGIISSRLAATGRIDVLSREATAEALKGLGPKEFTTAEITSLGKALNVNHVVWGSLTKIGNSISIEARLTFIAQDKPQATFVAQTQTLDEVIPRVGEIVDSIAREITGSQPTARLKPDPPAPVFTPPPASAPSPPAATASAREAEIISTLRTGGKKATLTSIINPEFINVPGSTGLDRRGFWMSNEFPGELKGLDIGDVNGDGLNEVVMIDATNVYIYQKKGQEFKQIHHLRGKSFDNYLSVDVADINKNGIPEIIITNIHGTLLCSLVLEFQEGKFKQIASDIRMFLRVINPNRGEPVLLGQYFGTPTPFNSPIYEVVWVNGQYRTGKRMKLPEGLPIYGLTIDSLGAGGDKIIAFNEFDNLTLYHPTDKPLSRINVFGGAREFIYRSEEVFGGSNNFLAPPANRDPNLEQINNVYLNLRIITYDLEGRGRRAIIIPKNITSVGRLFSNIRLFSGSEIYSLSWDGLGLAENWRTRKINGYVADYQIKDLDNDGKDEIVLIIVRGQTMGLTSNSILVSYDLTTN